VSPHQQLQSCRELEGCLSDAMPNAAAHLHVLHPASSRSQQYLLCSCTWHLRPPQCTQCTCSYVNMVFVPKWTNTLQASSACSRTSCRGLAAAPHAAPLDDIQLLLCSPFHAAIINDACCGVWRVLQGRAGAWL
jgi:hypothetical protein